MDFQASADQNEIQKLQVLRIVVTVAGLMAREFPLPALMIASRPSLPEQGLSNIQVL